MNTMSIAKDTNFHSNHKTGFGLVKVLLTIAIAGLIGVLSSSGMYANETPPTYRIPVFAGIVAVILLLSAGRVGSFSRRRLIMLFLWAGFAAMSLISGLLNNEDMLAMLWLSLGIPLLILCVFPHAAGRHGNLMVLLGIVLGFAPYIAASLILYPLNSSYRGVFSNANSIGMALATMSAAIFALLRGAISVKEKSVPCWTWIGVLCLTVGAAFPLIVLSNSRTSLITYAVLVMIFVWSLFFNRHKNRWWIVLTAVALLGAVSLFLVSGFSDDARTNYFGRIVDKMEEKTVSGDISGGRFGIWQAVISKIEWFGRGTTYFPQHYGANAHNTYFMVLGGLGPLALIFLVAVHGMAISIAYRRAVHNLRQDGYAIGPLLVVMNYMVLGLAELVFGILGNGINMSFLLMLGVLINENPANESAWQFEKADGLQGTVTSRLEGGTQ